MNRFNPFPPVFARYGAPMGRASTRAELFPADAPLCARKARGEYDSGGAYWGLAFPGSDGPVWAVWWRGKGHAEGVRYVRARNKAGAFARATDEG